MDDAPKTDEPVLLKAGGGDISVAFRHDNGDWFAFDVADPSDVRYVHAPEGWTPYPKTPEEAERMRQEVEAWTPQREIVAAYERRDAIQAQINALDAEEQAEQRRATQRQADERDAEAEAQRLRIGATSCRGATRDRWAAPL
jgi:hypothetical protein